MTREKDKIHRASQLTERASTLEPQEIVKLALEQFGPKIALASSLQAEDQVITDWLCQSQNEPAIFTLDTGRLPEETYKTIEDTNRFFDIHIEILFPDTAEVERLTREYGPNLFYQNIDLRKQCCHIRKVAPLRRKLKTLDAWITGQRRDQALTRGKLELFEWDSANGLIKVNPLAYWTEKQVWDYIHQRGLPYNLLHDQGYPSIGCAPCTRAVKPGEDVRAGRWWWEAPEQKECGLHLINGQLRPNKNRSI